jgi:hypothetical protein
MVEPPKGHSRAAEGLFVVSAATEAEVSKGPDRIAYSVKEQENKGVLVDRGWRPIYLSARLAAQNQG